MADSHQNKVEDAGKPQIDRRRMLQGGAALGAVAWVAPSVLRLDTVAAATGSGLNFCFDDKKLDGWSIDNKAGPDGRGKWKLEKDRSVSGQYSLHYGRGIGKTYDKKKKATSGTVTSPDFILAAAGPLQMSFWIWREIEDARTGNWDEFTVSIEQTGDVLYSRAADGGTNGAFEFVTIDLSAYAGSTINIVFGFATYDQNFNKFEGIYIDDIAFSSGISTPLTASRSEALRAPTGFFPARPPVDPAEVEARTRRDLEFANEWVELPPVGEKVPPPPTAPPATATPSTLPVAEPAAATPTTTSGPTTTTAPAGPTTSAPPTAPPTTTAPPTSSPTVAS